MSDDSEFTGPHTIKAMTWKATGSDKQVPVVVDLAGAIAKPLPTAKNWRVAVSPAVKLR